MAFEMIEGENFLIKFIRALVRSKGPFNDLFASSTSEIPISFDRLLTDKDHTSL
jgi:hypothetical protein